MHFTDFFGDTRDTERHEVILAPDALCDLLRETLQSFTRMLNAQK